MSIGSYTLKIKELCDSIGSINVSIDDDEMVQIFLGGLTPRFNAIQSIVLAREKSPSFFDLQLMLLDEENHVRTRSNTYDSQMLYTNSNKGRGKVHGRRGQAGQGRCNQMPPREQNFYYRQDTKNARGGASRRRGCNHVVPSRQNNSAQCGYCGKFDHYEAEYRKKKSESTLTRRQLANYASNSDYDNRGGMFVMRHRANSMIASNPVGDKAVNEEARATLCVMKNLCMRDKTRYAHREREAQRIDYI